MKGGFVFRARRVRSSAPRAGALEERRGVARRRETFLDDEPRLRLGGRISRETEKNGTPCDFPEALWKNRRDRIGNRGRRRVRGKIRAFVCTVDKSLTRHRRRSLSREPWMIPRTRAASYRKGVIVSKSRRRRKSRASHKKDPGRENGRSIASRRLPRQSRRSRSDSRLRLPCAFCFFRPRARRRRTSRRARELISYR